MRIPRHSIIANLQGLALGGALCCGFLSVACAQDGDFE